MSRLQGMCIGDCSKCELLGGGEVDMIPCILDQIFQRLQKNERMIATMMDRTERKMSFVSVEQETKKEDGL